MTTTQKTILWLYAAVVAVWPIRHAVLWYVFRTLDLLTPRSPRFSDPDPPLVTAIVPAKDEETSLPGCLASVCAQTYPNLEVLVVDDRSTDRTAEIAREFAATDPRVRVITIDHPPPAGRARRTPSSSPPARRAATGSGSSTPTPATSQITSRS